MDETRWLADERRLQEPQGDRRADNSAAFTPLYLRIEPAGLHIEVQRRDVVVGRHSDAEIRLALPDISRRHCRFAFENQQWRVYDLNSLNGVFVNGERMQEAALYEGDRLQLGTFTFIVEATAPIAAQSDDDNQIDILQSIAAAMKDQKRAS